MADDLWNDNRNLEWPLKTEVGATGVALGKALPCACVYVSVSNSFDILCWDLSYNSGIYVSSQICSADLSTLLLQNTNCFPVR